MSRVRNEVECHVEMPLGSVMTPETKRRRLVRAKGFIERELGGEPPSPKRLQDALMRVAGSMTPASWRGLRCALVTAQTEAGYFKAADRIAKTVNPVTQNGGKSLVCKRRKVTKVTAKDEAKLALILNDRGDKQAIAAIILARELGCRPCEMSTIRSLGNGFFAIKGGKKTKSRGADRKLKAISSESAARIEKAVYVLAGVELRTLKRIADRIRSAGKKCFPQRQAVPSLYSWRHQMGSNLKASGMSRSEIAYVMGHRSTESIEAYGNRKSGSGEVHIEPAADADLSNIRENHRDPPSDLAKQAAQMMSQTREISQTVKKECAPTEPKNRYELTYKKR